MVSMLLFSFEGIVRIALLMGVFGAIVIFGEYLRRSQILVGEGARKFVHAACGTWAALWPIFIDLNSIAVVFFALAIGAIILRQFKIFQSVYSIKRLSIGEILIGIGLGVAALLAKNGTVFASAVLIIAWSDSLAAIIGMRYGRKNTFIVLGSKKSYIGSFAFFMSTFVIVMTSMYYKFGSISFNSIPHLAGTIALSAFVSVCLTIIELTGVYGIDNLTIPIFATIVLNALL